jgi:hypothetical protein
MIELFANVSDRIKNETKFWVETAILAFDSRLAAETILKFKNTLNTEEEKDFVDFYFNLRMLQLREGKKPNESNSN